MVKVGDAKVGKSEDVLVSLGLGSCVAIILYDTAAKVGGMAHVLLPSATLAKDREKPGKFPETAVPHLITLIAGIGGAPERLRARLVGGASMFSNLATKGIAQMGERNVVASREALKHARIPLVAEDTGRDFGRSVYFLVGEGKVEVRSVQRGRWWVG